MGKALLWGERCFFVYISVIHGFDKSSFKFTLSQPSLSHCAGVVLLNYLQEALATHTNGCFAECFLREDFRTPLA